MIAPWFDSDPDAFRPRPEARGPWSPDMLHGRFLGGLAARVVEAESIEPGWRAARLTVDLFRPAAMAPVQVTTRTVRDGRRIRVVDAIVTCAGHEVARVTAVILATGEDPPGRIWRPEAETWPDPESVPPAEDGPDGPWLIRTVAGGFGTGQRSRVWTNDTAPLVDDEPLTPLVRAALAGDLACPMANSGDQGLYFINADYTLALARYPRGPWIGVEVAQQLASDGLSLGSATLVDGAGPFATSTGVSLATAPLESVTVDDGPSGTTSPETTEEKS